MHVLAPRPTWDQLPLFFNVDHHVGRQKTNSREDVLLVQFLIRKAGQTAHSVTSAETKSLMANLSVTGSCDDDTVAAIRAAQEHIRRGNPAAVVDSVVSPARAYDYGPNTRWTIVLLNLQMRLSTPQTWPRLQDLPDCPPELRQIFQNAL
jgi:hypothetical protein